MQANCSGCDFKKTYYLGSGILFGDIDAIKKMFDDNVVQEIDAYLSLNPEPTFSAEYVLCTCKKCNLTSALPQLTFLKADGEKIQLHNPCACGNKTVSKVIDDTKIICLQCKTSIVLEKTGKWD